MKNILVLFQSHKDTKPLLKKLAALTQLDEHINARFVAIAETSSKAKAQQKAEELHKWLDKHRAKLAGITASEGEFVECDDIATWLQAEHARTPLDLVIKLASRKPKKFVMPLDWKLLRHTQNTVLVASENKWRSQATVIATLDIESRSKVQSAINSKVLLTAHQWAQAAGMQLKALYIVPLSAAWEELDVLERRDVLSKKEARLKSKIEQLAQTLGVPLNDVIIDIGNPVKKIPSKVNKNKADLVVMGNVGRTGIKGFLLGNTAEQVLANLRTDVLVVKP